MLRPNSPTPKDPQLTVILDIFCCSEISEQLLKEFLSNLA